MEVRTLKHVFYGLLTLDLLANLVSIVAYFWLKTVAILIVMGIFDIIIIIPVTVIFGIFIFLFNRGHNLKNDALAHDLFKSVPISHK